MSRTKGNEAEAGFSRSEAELLCMVLALGADGCTLAELAGRLGLSAVPTVVMEEAAGALLSHGLAEETEAVLRPSELGRLRLADARRRIGR